MDLNLYPVFLEIMRHGSVSRAAEALGLTQPAASNALARLRAQLGDPLFMRTRNGMLPTHFAKDIQPLIEKSLEGLRSVSTDTDTELPPLREIGRHFTVVMSDLEETLFLPDLVESLAHAAPGVSLEIRAYRRDALQAELETNRVDFVLAHLSAVVKNVASQPLSQQHFVCLARRDHPSIKDRLSLAAYTGQGHLLVSPDRGGRRGVVDDRLRELGKSRKVVCSVPHFLSACLLASRSDHLLTVPRLLGEQVSEPFGLRLHNLPFEMPGFMIGLHWHHARDSDPEHESLRNFMLDLLRRKASTPT